MKIEKIALQLYTLRDFIRTPGEIAETLKKVARIGYRAVQVSGMGPIDEGELVAICAGEGLTICATHEPGDVILSSPEKVVARLARLGCKYTAYPYPREVDFADESSVKRLIEGLERSGTVLADAGQTLLYHNHAHEFVRSGNSTILERIYAETSPRALAGEPDTYWIQYGGGNPVTFIEKLSGRVPVLHCKDYAVEIPDKPSYAEVGSGNLDWAAIIAAAEKAGTEWFVVEQDTCPGDPFESITSSFNYLATTFVS